MSDEILFSNFTYDPDTYYFIYIGDIKAYGLNYFLRDMFARTLQKSVEFIAIVPDLFAQYNYDNIIVINPLISDYRKKYGEQLSFRLDGAVFMQSVSASPVVRQLIDKILENQNHLYLNLYESKPEMTLDELDRVTLLGPDKKLANRFNNKVVQYEMLKDHIPVIEFRLCEGMVELLETTARLRTRWTDGIFVTRAYSAAGAGSAVTESSEDIERNFSGCSSNELFLISPYLPHTFDPTVLGVVANESDVYIAGVADQRIEGGNRFVGSTYPSVLPEDKLDELKDITRKTGRILGRHGYRGIFGCDYLIDRENEIRFLEINARKQGTTLEFCYTLQQSLPLGSPILPELEYYAVTENRFPANTLELKGNENNVHWGTYNFKLLKQRRTQGYIPQNPHEEEMFQNVAAKKLFKDFVILEHIGSNYTVLPGTFLARVVAVAKNHDDVKEGLHQGITFIEQTVAK